VDPGKLDMLGDAVDDHLAVLCHAVDLNLLRALQELGDDHRVLRGDQGGLAQVLVERALGLGDVHRGAGKNVGRPDQHGIPGLRGKGARLLDVLEFLPRRLDDTKLVEQGREAVPVFRPVNRVRLGAENANAAAVQAEREVVWYLPAHRDHDSHRPFELDDVQHPFERQLLEIEPVVRVVVGRNGFGVAVDHHGAVAELRRGRAHAD
jgi:hypothetical protein